MPSTLLYKSALIAALAGVSFIAHPAEAGIIEEVPTTWRLQNYIGNHEIAVWYSSAAGCTSGKLGFSGATAEELNRFQSTVLNAKVTGRPVGIAFSETCVMRDF